MVYCAGLFTKNRKNAFTATIKSIPNKYRLSHPKALYLRKDGLWLGTRSEREISVVNPYLNVVPNRASKPRRVHISPSAHRVISQIVGSFKLRVQQCTHVVVQPVDCWVAMIVPGIVLDTERVNVALGPLGKVLVLKGRIVHKVADIGGGFLGLWPDHAQFSRLHLKTSPYLNCLNP